MICKKMRKYILLLFIPVLLSVAPFQNKTIYSFYNGNTKWVFDTESHLLECYPSKSYKIITLSETETLSIVELFEEAKQTKNAHTKRKNMGNSILEIETKSHFESFFLKEKSKINIKLSKELNQLIKPKL